MCKRIYISGKIKHYEEYREHFERAESNLKIAFPDADIISPVTIGDQIYQTYTNPSYKDFLDADFKELQNCTHIYMLNNWCDSPGARAEYAYARAVDMTILHEPNFYSTITQGAL